VLVGLYVLLVILLGCVSWTELRGMVRGKR